MTLGVDSLGFEGPGTAALLVTATPAVIPSNGTVASIITATFACGSNTGTLVNGFPLLNRGFPTANSLTPSGTSRAANVVNRPAVVGTGQVAACGAGLPGGFTFSAPHNILFDNGRSTEGVTCGVGPNVSPFGGEQSFCLYSSAAPLVFTCTGAAVMAQDDN